MINFRWIIFAVLLSNGALASGVQWHQGSFPEVLAAAKAQDKIILVEVYATWCPPCKLQTRDVFDDKSGQELTRDLVAWRVDFDAANVQHLMKRWNVLSLPTVLFLRPDGSEIDRIEGYDDKTSFLKEAYTRIRGLDPLPEMVRRLAKEKRPSVRLPLLVEVSHRRLVRGEIEAGLAGLETAALIDADGKLGAAENALFLMGRYLSRVEGKYVRSRHVWRELYYRFPEGKYARTAVWWYAGAVHELHHDELADAIFTHFAHENPGGGLGIYASFVEEKQVLKHEFLTVWEKNKRRLKEAERTDIEKIIMRLP